MSASAGIITESLYNTFFTVLTRNPLLCYMILFIIFIVVTLRIDVT